MKVGEIWFYTDKDPNRNQFAVVLKSSYMCPSYYVVENNPIEKVIFYETNPVPKEIENKLYIPSVEVWKCDLYFSHLGGKCYDLYKSYKWITNNMWRVNEIL